MPLRIEADAEQAFVVGGAELYRSALPHADRMHLTLVDAEPAAMAGALRTFLEDPQGAAEFGRRARAWVLEHWSMPAAIDRLESFFERTARSEKT